MKLLIMGVGYVGMAFLKSLQGSSNEIFATTTRDERVEVIKPYVHHVLVLGKEGHNVLHEAVETCDALVILVAPQGKRSYEETYLGTSKTISSILERRKKTIYLLYTSSTSVYEGIQSGWANEEMFLSPTSEKGRILLETENIYLKFTNSCILRLGGIYGPGRELIARARALSGKELSGSGGKPTNHIHLEDIVSAIHFCLEHRLTGVYNLVNDDHPTRHELYSGLCTSLGISLPAWNLHLPESGAVGYKVSNDKICSAGFSLKFVIAS